MKQCSLGNPELCSISDSVHFLTGLLFADSIHCPQFWYKWESRYLCYIHRTKLQRDENILSKILKTQFETYFILSLACLTALSVTQTAKQWIIMINWRGIERKWSWPNTRKFAWMNWEKSRKIPVYIIFVPDEIRTGHHPNISQTYLCLSQLTR
jgi:hypothetical protein